MESPEVCLEVEDLTTAGDMRGKVESEVEIATSYGFPPSVCPEDVIFLELDGYAISMETTTGRANKRPRTLERVPKGQALTSVTLHARYDYACTQKLEEYYPYPTSLNEVVDMDVPSSSPTSSQATPTPSQQIPNHHSNDSASSITYEDLGIRDAMGLFVCSYCSRTFITINQLRQHSSDEHQAPAFRCKLCQMTFKQPRTLINHTLIHTGERNYKCYYCEASFRIPTKRNAHVRRVHGDEFPHKCEECPEAFRTFFECNSHRRLAHPADISCSGCGEVFKTRSELSDHTCPERTIKCKPCGKSYTNANDLVKHLRSCRYADLSVTTCKLCGKEFDSAAKCAIHLASICSSPNGL